MSGTMTYPGHVKGTFARQPLGLILHGSRSGKPYTPMVEFSATACWAANPENPYGWNATIGPGVYSVHMTARQWGLNAGDASTTHLAVECAQALPGQPITDDFVAALLTYWRREVLPVWPDLDLLADGFALIGHPETPQGRADQKSDPFPAGDARLADLKRRIRAAWRTQMTETDALLEAAYRANSARLGNKRFKARIVRPFFEGDVLVCDRGVIAPDRDVMEGATDDLVTYWEQSGVMRRY